MGFTYLKYHDLLTYSIVMRHLGYLEFGINPENVALNILVHVLHILALYPRGNFVLDIIFECLLLSRNYESRLGTGIKSWKTEPLLAKTSRPYEGQWAGKYSEL